MAGEVAPIKLPEEVRNAPRTYRYLLEWADRVDQDIHQAPAWRKPLLTAGAALGLTGRALEWYRDRIVAPLWGTAVYNMLYRKLDYSHLERGEMERAYRRGGYFAVAEEFRRRHPWYSFLGETLVDPTMWVGPGAPFGRVALRGARLAGLARVGARVGRELPAAQRAYQAAERMYQLYATGVNSTWDTGARALTWPFRWTGKRLGWAEMTNSTRLANFRLKLQALSEAARHYDVPPAASLRAIVNPRYYPSDEAGFRKVLAETGLTKAAIDKAVANAPPQVQEEFGWAGLAELAYRDYLRNKITGLVARNPRQGIKGLEILRRMERRRAYLSRTITESFPAYQEQMKRILANFQRFQAAEETPPFVTEELADFIGRISEQAANPDAHRWQWTMALYDNVASFLDDLPKSEMEGLTSDLRARLLAALREHRRKLRKTDLAYLKIPQQGQYRSMMEALAGILHDSQNQLASLIGATADDIIAELGSDPHLAARLAYLEKFGTNPSEQFHGLLAILPEDLKRFVDPMGDNPLLIEDMMLVMNLLSRDRKKVLKALEQVRQNFMIQQGRAGRPVTLPLLSQTELVDRLGQLRPQVLQQFGEGLGLGQTNTLADLLEGLRGARAGKVEYLNSQQFNELADVLKAWGRDGDLFLNDAWTLTQNRLVNNFARRIAGEKWRDPRLTQAMEIVGVYNQALTNIVRGTAVGQAGFLTVNLVGGMLMNFLNSISPLETLAILRRSVMPALRTEFRSARLAIQPLDRLSQVSVDRMLRMGLPAAAATQGLGGKLATTGRPAPKTLALLYGSLAGSTVNPLAITTAMAYGFLEGKVLLPTIHALGFAIEHSLRLPAAQQGFVRHLTEHALPTFEQHLAQWMTNPKLRVPTQLLQKELRQVGEALGNFTPEEVAAAARRAGFQEAQINELWTLWNNLRGDAALAGEANANRIHFDYERLNHFRDLAKQLMTFPTFATYAIPEYGRQMLLNPWFAVALHTLYKKAQLYNRLQGKPESAEGTLPNNLFGYLMRLIFQREVRGQMNVLTGLYPIEQPQRFTPRPGEELSFFEEAINVLDQLGGFLPQTEVAIKGAAVAGALAGRATGRPAKLAAQFLQAPAPDLFPSGRRIEALGDLYGDGVNPNDPVTSLLDNLVEKFTGQQVRQPEIARINRLLAIRAYYDDGVLLGEPGSEAYVEALSNPEHALFQEARQQVRFIRALQRLYSDLGIGGRVSYVFTPEEEALLEQRKRLMDIAPIVTGLDPREEAFQRIVYAMEADPAVAALSAGAGTEREQALKKAWMIYSSPITVLRQSRDPDLQRWAQEPYAAQAWERWQQYRATFPQEGEVPTIQDVMAQRMLRRDPAVQAVQLAREEWLTHQPLLAQYVAQRQAEGYSNEGVRAVGHLTRFIRELEAQQAVPTTRALAIAGRTP